MKNKKRLALILTIVAVLLFAIGVYIMVFKTNVTSDYYVSRGSKALNAGRYSAAIKHYSTAMKMNKREPEIPIGLANAYKGAGNYTKAEYTLVNAIGAHPDNIALYVSLSRVYVEQEKFLDADLMLSQITDEKVKAELNKLRPAPPALTPESGYYSTYVTVSASCPAGRIFLTTTGEYPFSEADLYSGPIQLPGGETTICAMVVDDSGLVSQAIHAGYTVAGVIEPVTISDPALDAIIREAIGKTEGEEIITSELWSIEELTITQDVSDLSQLSLLTGLKKLDMSGVTADDLSAIAAIPNLVDLNLSGCVLSSDSRDILGTMTQLTHLNLSGCALRSVDTLSNLVRLSELDISNNVISDISVLSGFSSLKKLSVKNNPISSLSALSNCTELEELDVSSCDISSLDDLAAMSKLTFLDASNNKITSISALESCAALETLLLSSNDISGITVVTKLPKLKIFDGSYNSISSIPDFGSNHPIESINLKYNSISHVNGLSGLHSLNYLMLDYNSVSDLSPLANCYNLVQVDAWSNPVTESSVAALQEKSIIVNYKPN